MRIITIVASDEVGNEIREWVRTHKVILIASTVPRLKHWTFSTDDVSIEEIP